MEFEHDLVCESCGADVLDIDVKCAECGARLASTGAQRMLGSMVLGQYEITDILGQGGMSVVYKGRHRLTEQEVALKILPPELAAHSQVKSRFLEEAKALAQLDHPNIVHLYNFGQEAGCFVLAMQFVAGATWERLIIENDGQEWANATRIAIDVLRALEYAHERGIVHRDMKPSNVLVRAHDGIATVMDFGIAKMTTSTKLTATGQTMGTVRYMSPEQVRGQKVDFRTDIYSLGATLYEAVVGDTPFDGETHFEIMTKHLNEPPRPPTALGASMPLALEEAVMRALAKRAEDRWGSARELRKALEALLRDADVGTAETMRLSRDEVATASAASSAAGIATADETAADGGDRISGIAQALEPGEDDVDLGFLEPARSGRPKLWIGLAGLVLVVATGVVLLVNSGSREQRGAGAEQPAIAADAAAAPAVDERFPEAFAPADVTFDVEEEWTEEALRVAAVGAADPARLRDAYRDAHERFAAVLGEMGVADALEHQPMSVFVVPQSALCDERNYKKKDRVPRDAEACRVREIHYRPGERTLLVLDDDARLEANIAYGVALAVCIHTDIPKCGEALDVFDRRLQAGGGE